MCIQEIWRISPFSYVRYENTTGHGYAWRLHDKIGPAPRIYGVSDPSASEAGLSISGGRQLASPFRLFWLAIRSTCVYEIVVTILN